MKASRSLHHALIAAATASVVIMGMQLMIRGGASTPWDQLFSSGLYNAIPLLAGVGCLVRPSTSPRERRGWSLIGVGLVFWGLGDIYYTFAFWSTPEDEIPFPSIADALYLGFYPPVLVGLGLLVREHLVRFSRSLWLDALIAALTVAAISSALIVDVVVGSTSGSVAVVATNLAYPVGDVVLLGVVVGFGALARRQLSSSWLLIAGGLGLFAVSDGFYLVRVSEGAYNYGTLLDLGWLLAIGLVGIASALRMTTLSHLETGEDAFVPGIPVTLAAVNIGLMIWDHYHRLDQVALLLCSLALVGVVVRMVLSMRDNRVMLRLSRSEAITDSLTDLNNRRKFESDLREALARRDASERILMLLFDLDGFKGYNDRFGHPAGDVLLSRLAAKLSIVAEKVGGRAYRLGGDEFSILVPLPAEELGPSEAPAIQAEAMWSLTETGEGFSIGSSCGTVVVPDEANDPEEALRLADMRMYEDKNTRPSAGKQVLNVLVSALGERDPDLKNHTDNVSTLAASVAVECGLSGDEVERIRLAALLHDIGKIAIPDSILSKPGPLDEAEWEFMHRHTVVGERILAAAPSLRDVGQLVRSSHERWDGHGYPDRLAGSKIPLGARIVFACDAFDAMISRRDYQGPMPIDEAFAELRWNAGTQFDADVVERLIACVGRSSTITGERLHAA